MTDRASQESDNQPGENGGGQALEQARRQILLHERHDRKQSMLSCAASFVLRNGSGESLRELKTLYQEAKDAREKTDAVKAGQLEKQLKAKVQADRAALSWQDETNGYATGFAKTMGLFMKGGKGVALTALSFGLDQICAGEKTTFQATDLALGIGKGLLTRKVLGAGGGLKMGIAGEAVTLAIGSRLVDQALTRGNYFDATGTFSISQALQSINRVALDRTALASDVATFAGARLFFGAASRFSNGALERNPFLTTVLTGTTFGASSGAAGEIIRQHESGQSLDLGRIFRCALVQGLVDSVAATPGGLQADASLRARLAGKVRTSFDWLNPASRATKAVAEIVPVPNQLEVKAAPQQESSPAVLRVAASESTVTIPGGDGIGSLSETKVSGHGKGNETKTGVDADVSKVVPERSAERTGQVLVEAGQQVDLNSGSSNKAESLATKKVEASAAAQAKSEEKGTPANQDVAAVKAEPPNEARPAVPIAQARSELISSGAHRETVARMSDRQVRAVQELPEAARAYFVDDALADKQSSAERVNDAIGKANDFLKLPLRDRIYEAEREMRALHSRLGLDSKKPLSPSEWTKLERTQDLLRTSLGSILDEIAKPDGPARSAESRQELQELFTKKVSDLLLKPLDIGNVKTLSGGNAQELIVLKEMVDAIRRAGKEGQFQIVRLLSDHAADHCGFDFALVDTRSGRLLPVDASARNKLEKELPEMRSRTLVTVPDPKRDDIKDLWARIKQQQGISADTAMPSVPEMLRLRCDYVIQLLESSPIRVTDIRLLFDELADRQEFSRKITDADRREIAENNGGMGKRWLFELSTGDLIDTTFKRNRTLSHGMEAMLRRAMLTLDRATAQGVAPDAAALAQLDTTRRLIQLQRDSIGRFIHDMDKLAARLRESGNNSAADLLEQFASHTEQGSYSFWSRKLSDRYGIVARINRALGR